MLMVYVHPQHPLLLRHIKFGVLSICNLLRVHKFCDCHLLRLWYHQKSRSKSPSFGYIFDYTTGVLEYHTPSTSIACTRFITGTTNTMHNVKYFLPLCLLFMYNDSVDSSKFWVSGCYFKGSGYFKTKN